MSAVKSKGTVVLNAVSHWESKAERGHFESAYALLDSLSKPSGVVFQDFSNETFPSPVSLTPLTTHLPKVLFWHLEIPEKTRSFSKFSRSVVFTLKEVDPKEINDIVLKEINLQTVQNLNLSFSQLLPESEFESESDSGADPKKKQERATRRSEAHEPKWNLMTRPEEEGGTEGEFEDERARVSQKRKAQVKISSALGKKLNESLFWTGAQTAFPYGYDEEHLASWERTVLHKGKVFTLHPCRVLSQNQYVLSLSLPPSSPLGERETEPGGETRPKDILLLQSKGVRGGTERERESETKQDVLSLWNFAELSKFVFSLVLTQFSDLSDTELHQLSFGNVTRFVGRPIWMTQKREKIELKKMKVKRLQKEEEFEAETALPPEQEGGKGGAGGTGGMPETQDFGKWLDDIQEGSKRLENELADLLKKVRVEDKGKGRSGKVAPEPPNMTSRERTTGRTQSAGDALMDEASSLPYTPPPSLSSSSTSFTPQSRFSSMAGGCEELQTKLKKMEKERDEAIRLCQKNTDMEEAWKVIEALQLKLRNLESVVEAYKKKEKSNRKAGGAGTATGGKKDQSETSGEKGGDSDKEELWKKASQAWEQVDPKKFRQVFEVDSGISSSPYLPSED